MVPVILFSVIGIGLGFALGKGAGDSALQDSRMYLALGLVWAFILLQWLDILAQAFALFSEPVDDKLDLGDTAAVQKAASGMKRSPEMMNRTANLLQAWGQSRSPQAVVDLAAFQSSRARKPILTGAVFGVLVLYAIGLSAGAPAVVWGAGVVLGLTLLAKMALLSRIDAYLETQFLSRLPGSSPSNVAGGPDAALGDSISQSINTALNQYIPKPEELASAILEGVNQASNAISEQGNLIAKALEDTKTDLVNSLSGSGQNMAAQLSQVQSALQSSLQGAGKEAVDQLTAALSSQSDRLEHTSASLVSQIEQLVQLESNFQTLLNVQNSIEAAIGGMTASTQWQETLNALTAHLAESDKLLKEASKPRMITLVEEG